MTLPVTRRVLVLLLPVAACSKKPPDPAPAPVPVHESPPPPIVRTVVDTVVVRDSTLEREVARLKGRMAEKDGRIETLEAQLASAQEEVARMLAKSQGNRAEAATAIAEAELAIRSAKGVPSVDVTAARRTLKKASEAFDASNFAGAVYYANQAKGRVASSRRPKGNGRPDSSQTGPGSP
jgi:hypothetical protein